MTNGPSMTITSDTHAIEGRDNTPLLQDAATQDPPALIKKIGKMTYIVRVHFSTTSKETFNDKVKRMLREEVRQMMEDD